jgi:hypothetical protein
LRDIVNFANDDTIDFVEVSMPYAVITNSNYIVDSQNNILVINFSGADNTYTFPAGNYNATMFIQQFRELIPTSFSISLNSRTSKFTISNTEIR